MAPAPVREVWVPVHPRSLWHGEDPADALGREHLIEQPGELAVPVSDRALPGDLAGGWVRRDTQHVDPPVACSTTAKQYSRVSR